MTVTFNDPVAVPHKYRNRFLRDGGSRASVNGGSGEGGQGVDLSAYLSKSDAEALYLLRSRFDELFEKVTLDDGTSYIRAKLSLASDGGLSAYGYDEDERGGLYFRDLEDFVEPSASEIGRAWGVVSFDDDDEPVYGWVDVEGSGSGGEGKTYVAGDYIKEIGADNKINVDYAGIVAQLALPAFGDIVTHNTLEFMAANAMDGLGTLAWKSKVDWDSDVNNRPSINGKTLTGAVTLSEIGAQGVISDLETIRSGAAAGATALQSFTEADPVFTAHQAHNITADMISVLGKLSLVGGKLKIDCDAYSTGGISAYGDGDEEESEGSIVEWSQLQASGQKIAEICIDGVTTNVYAPDGRVYTGGSGISVVENVISADLSVGDVPDLPWGKITSGKPTTLGGYGITDAYTKSEVDAKVISGTYKVWGQKFVDNGSLKDVSGAMSDVTSIDSFVVLDSTNGLLTVGAANAKHVTVGDGGVMLHQVTPYIDFHKDADANRWTRLINVSNGVLELSAHTKVAGETLTPKLKIGGGYVTWNDTYGAFELQGNVYASGGVSAYGLGLADSEGGVTYESGDSYIDVDNDNYTIGLSLTNLKSALFEDNVEITGRLNVDGYIDAGGFVDGSIYGTADHVVLGNGTLKALSEITAIADADTLDGEHADGFVRAGAINSGTLNSLGDKSFIKSVNTSGEDAPYSYNDWYHCIQMAHRNGYADGSDYVGQILVGMLYHPSEMWFRGSRKGKWVSVVSSANIGYQTVDSIRDNSYHDIEHRRGTANNVFADGSLRYYLATSEMSSATGKPKSDAHILHCSWDNGNWDSQLALLNSGNGIQFRGQYRKSDDTFAWSDWKDVITSDHLSVDDSGNIGIGTTPEYKLDVNGTTRTTNLIVTDTLSYDNLTVSGVVNTPKINGSGDGGTLSISANSVTGINALEVTQLKSTGVLTVGSGSGISKIELVTNGSYNYLYFTINGNVYRVTATKLNQ